MNIEKIYQHLAEYKRNDLGITINGIWKKNGKEYAHILPEDQQDKNLIQSKYYDELLRLIEYPSIKLHKDFHHLNCLLHIFLSRFYAFDKNGYQFVTLTN